MSGSYDNAASAHSSYWFASEERMRLIQHAKALGGIKQLTEDVMEECDNERDYGYAETLCDAAHDLAEIGEWLFTRLPPLPPV